MRKFNQSAVAYLEITPKIIEGNSGGPVLNSSFDVIGVAVKGLNSSTPLSNAEFVAIAASEIAHLL